MYEVVKIQILFFSKEYFAIQEVVECSIECVLTLKWILGPSINVSRTRQRHKKIKINTEKNSWRNYQQFQTANLCSR